MRMRVYMPTRRWLKLLNLALVAVLAVVVFEVIIGPLRDRVPQSASGTTRQPDAAVPVGAGSVARNGDGLPGRNLFGGESEAASATPAASLTGRGESLPVDANLKLSGIVEGGPDVARVIIQDVKGGAADVYKTGDRVGTFEIVQIERDRVILAQGVKRYVLWLAVSSSPKEPAGTAASSPVASAKAVDVPLERKGFNLAEIKASGVEALLKTATLEPYVVADQTEGFKISGIGNLEVAKLVGLKDGDVVRKLNGQQITSKQKAFEVMQKARQQGAFDVELLRDGQVKHLSIGR